NRKPFPFYSSITIPSFDSIFHIPPRWDTTRNCPKCGNPVDDHYCQGCALLRTKFKEDLFTYCIENGILQDLLSHPMTIPTLLMLFKSHSLSNKTPNRVTIKTLISRKIFMILNNNIFVVKIAKIPFYYDDDDDEEYTIAITPKEPDYSLSMRNEHLDTIPAMESDEFIKSSVENLVPNPCESEGEHKCDEIYSNPLFDEEIISMKIDPHHFNVESDLIESLLNHDSLIISSSSKIDSLLDEFAGELTLLKYIPPRINETDCDPEEETRLIKDIIILEELLRNNSLSLLENKSVYFDIPSSSHPPTKPPDGNGYRQKDKIQANPDKTEHEMESVKKSKVNQSQQKVNPVKVKNGAEEPIENQSLPADASPTSLSPGYVVDSDPEKDEKDHKEDPAYYPADRGDNDDDESSNDDDDDDDD
nr:hypothetical protein [Tanacetum cinerariifolium]